MSLIVKRMEVVAEYPNKSENRFNSEIYARPNKEVTKEGLNGLIDKVFNSIYDYELKLSDFLAIEGGRLTCVYRLNDDKQLIHDIYIKDAEKASVEKMVDTLDVRMH